MTGWRINSWKCSYQLCSSEQVAKVPRAKPLRASACCQWHKLFKHYCSRSFEELDNIEIRDFLRDRHSLFSPLLEIRDRPSHCLHFSAIFKIFSEFRLARFIKSGATATSSQRLTQPKPSNLR